MGLEQTPTALAAPLRCAVLGGGSWGTALASVLAEHHEVALWARDPLIIQGINDEHRNLKYQRGFVLSPRIRGCAQLEEALAGAELVLIAVPSAGVRSLASAIAPLLAPGTLIICAAKGIEVESLMTMEQVLSSTLPRAHRSELSFLSGPSFAAETLARSATAVTIAARFPDIALRAQRAVSTSYFRVYRTEDVTGVELGGALKNVIAIAAGVADGLSLGHNSRAALITRGIAEISRLAVSMGANPLTLSGLAGLGDLVLTCTGGLSRNRHVGVELGRGRSLEQILDSMDQVAEGVLTAKSVYALAQREQVEMPICEEVYRMLYEQKPAPLVLRDLMTRQPKQERDR